MNTLDEIAPPPLEVASMSKIQKLAALLVILGPDTAPQILKSLSVPDLELVSAEMARLPMITQEARLEILREMSQVALNAGTGVRGGVEFTQTALEKALGNKAGAILNRISPQRHSSEATRMLGELEPRHLFNSIKDEHPQTITLVVSCLRPDKASELLALLRPELRDQIIERLATLEASPVEVLDRIVEVVNRRLQGRTERGMHQSGGLKTAADVLNALNKNLSKTIISSLEERNAELGQAIRQKMFTFNDLIRLDLSALQKVMREVDIRDLALALKKADEALKAKLLSAVSKRAGETVMEEMSFMGSVKLKEIDAARIRIIEVVRKLEGEGEIDLENGGESEAA